WKLLKRCHCSVAAERVHSYFSFFAQRTAVSCIRWPSITAECVSRSSFALRWARRLAGVFNFLCQLVPSLQFPGVHFIYKNSRLYCWVVRHYRRRRCLAGNFQQDGSACIVRKGAASLIEPLM